MLVAFAPWQDRRRDARYALPAEHGSSKHDDIAFAPRKARDGGDLGDRYENTSSYTCAIKGIGGKSRATRD